MKQSAKVFIWIGMILQFFLIYPIVVGVLALKKIDEAKLKEDLKTLGIFTLFFCSLIGGIFMLNIKDEELSNSSNNTIITKEEKVIENKELDKKEKIVKIITQFGIYIICPLVVICLLFSISLVEVYEGVAGIPLILNICLLALFIPILIIYCINKQRLNETSAILLMIFSIISTALFILSIVTNYCFAYTIETYSSWGSYTHTYNNFGNSWETWTIFGLAIAITTISIVVLILNLKTKQIGKSKTTHIVEIKKTSKIEIELNEITSLYANKVITEEEYKNLRTIIISKYYK